MYIKKSTVGNDDIGGEGVFIDRNYHLGDQIHSDVPVVGVLFMENIRLYCAYCFKCISHIERHIKCNQCQMVYYCSSDCQNANTIQHHVECDILQYPPFINQKPYASSSSSSSSASSFEYPSVLRMAAKIIALSNHNNILTRINKTNYLDDIIIDKQQLHPATSEIIVQFEQYLARNPKHINNPDINFSKLFIYLKTNLITIGDDGCIGVGLYELFSKINHKCIPNCVASFINNHMYLYPTRELFQDEELFVNYCSTTIDLEQRQTTLANDYYFKCQCEMCTLKGTHPSDVLLSETDDFKNNQQLYNGCRNVQLGTNNNQRRNYELCRLLIDDPPQNDTFLLKLTTMITLSNDMGFIEGYPKLVYQLVGRILNAYKAINGGNISQIYAKYYYYKVYFEKNMFHQIHLPSTKLPHHHHHHHHHGYDDPSLMMMTKARDLYANICQCEKLLRLFYPSDHELVLSVVSHKNELSHI